MSRPATRSRALVAGAAATVLLAGCGGAGATEGSDGGEGSDRTVVAAFYPLAWVSEQVAGDSFQVQNLTTAGGEPHDLELGISQTAEVAGADLVVYEKGFQPAVDEAVETTAEGDTLDVIEVVDLLPVAEGHDHAEDEHADEEHAEGEDHAEEDHAEEEHAEGEDHAEEEHAEGEEHEHALEGDLDPHFWLDPVRLADVGDAVADQLSELDPDGAAGYAERAAALRTELEALGDEYAQGLRGCARNVVVVSHDAFNYLTPYGLTFEPIAGLTPDAEPTAATLAHLREVIEEDGITTVFSETLASPAMADSLAQDAGVETAVLDPIEGLSDQTEGEDYLSLMRANLEALQSANDCG